MLQDNFVILTFQEAKQPEYKEKRGVGYIEFGERNDYPNYLLNLYNKSSKHAAIIRGKVNYITGNGWAGSNQQFIDHPNRFENLFDLTRKVSIDIEIFGGAYLELIWSEIGGKLVEVNHIDYTKLRANKDCTTFWYKYDWKNSREKAEVISGFNVNRRVGKQILYIKEYRPNLITYALPNYMAALNFIESDIEVSRHILGNAQTGFSPSKLITLPNGEPTEEEIRMLTKRFEKTYTGSEGKKFILSFVNDATRKPIIDDLGQSDLTKEDFSRVDSMIQQNIFAAHQLTSPSLFGISEAGKLGTRNEIRDAYEIFKNTYVNDKQKFLESIFNLLSEYNGGAKDLVIQPVEPIAYEFSEQTLLQIAPKDWLLEKIGIDLTNYTNSTTVSGTPIANDNAIVPNQTLINDNIKNLTGRQHQQLVRIIRQYGQGKITKEVATTLLKTGLGLSDEDIFKILGVDDNNNFSAHDEDYVIDLFSKYGVPKSDYEVITSRPIKFDEQHFEITDANNKKLLKILKDNPKATIDDMMKALGEKKNEIQNRLNILQEEGAIKVNESSGERTLTKPMSELIDKPLKTEIVVRYSYEWKSDVPSNERDTEAHPSRPFCKKLMKLDRYWTRKEIEELSYKLGYSVFDRGGGWWGDSPSCRHYWFSNVLIKKN